MLLSELARADAELSVPEEEQLRALLQRRYALAPDEAAALLDEAHARGRATASLHGYLDTLNRELGAEQKLELIEMLWRTAYADGRLDPHEEQLLRRLADLLYVSHADFIRTKLEVTGQR